MIPSVHLSVYLFQLRKSNTSQPSDQLPISLTSLSPISSYNPRLHPHFSSISLLPSIRSRFSSTTMAVDLVGIQTIEHLNRIFQLKNHDFAVSSNFKQAVSALKRSGHARFRRGPPPSSSDQHAPSISSQSEEKRPKNPPPGESTTVSKDCSLKRSVTDTISSFQLTTSSLVSSLAGEGLEGSVSNGKQLSSLGIVAPAPSFSSRKPPLPSSHRKRHSTDRPSATLQGSGKEDHSASRTPCHCCKRRYEQISPCILAKTYSIPLSYASSLSIGVSSPPPPFFLFRKTVSKQKTRRIPIIGSKIESIPADDYSWKKYGEKKVDGSLFPRVYYKCNSAKGCPARKRVELSVTDSKMLLVTYDGEHHHHHTPTPLPASLTALTIQSK
ncbi:DNA-binding WRKY [Cynara cardunculus var. scolymus]|uniref:DNA-binding WRKY n=1 Tax=Cynara cardunculus var. scolymus TaxID=59895 RepID=A0A103XBH0_CYNCS|nr:DNA-binding WRKY [Cynara cardunculus var. scolymus]